MAWHIRQVLNVMQRPIKPVKMRHWEYFHVTDWKRMSYPYLAVAIRKIATEGTMVVVSSLEEGELIGLADRILVLREGRQVTILDGQSANDHMLAALAAGGTIH